MSSKGGNPLVIYRMLRKERTTFGKEMRQKYESGEIKLSRHKMTRSAMRPDELANTLTTVQKDNTLLEIHWDDVNVSDQSRGIWGHCVGLNFLDEGDGFMTQAQYKDETPIYTTAPFTYASAFAGIGGMSMGLAPLGGKGVMAWEYDPTEKRTQFAQNAHRLLHPNIPVEGDICEANTATIPDFDLFCFTPPCQAFSVAGRRGGFDDTRGTLTFEALRIANAKRPKVLFMENVKGLCNHDKGNTLATIIHAINEIGYTVDFTTINSKFFDVAQNRDRVYMIGVRDDLITPEPWTDVKGTTMLHKAKRRLQEEGVKSFNFDWPPQTEVRTRLRDFLEEWVDERYYLSEEKTATLIAQLEERVKNSPQGVDYNRKMGVGNTREIAACISASDWLGLNRNQTQTAIAELETGSEIEQGISEDTARIIELGKLKEHRHSSLANSIHDVGGISSTLDTMQGGGREPKIAEEVRPVLTPDRIHKQQNGRRFKENEEEAFTLTAIDRQGVAVGTYPRYRIRKLTARECLRLQAVPEPMIDLLLSSFSSSRCYKFAGNGLTSHVIRAIGERLLPYLQPKIDDTQGSQLENGSQTAQPQATPSPIIWHQI